MEVTASSTKNCSEVLGMVDSYGDLDFVFMKRQFGIELVNEPPSIIPTELPVSTELMHGFKKRLVDLEFQKKLLKRKVAVANYKRNVCKPRTRQYQTRGKESKQKVITLFQNGVNNIELLSRKAKCSTWLARKAISEYQISGAVLSTARDSLNKHKKICTSIAIDNLQTRVDFITAQKVVNEVRVTNQLKISKTFANAGLRSKGLKWSLVKKVKKVRTESSDVDVCHILGYLHMILVCLQSKEKDVYFIDEMKFPGNQEPLKAWSKTNKTTIPVVSDCFNREMITAAVCCNFEGFVSIQFFSSELTGKDFSNFVAMTMNKIKKDTNSQPYFFCDQATWHTAVEVTSTNHGKALVFNLPGKPELNFIEGTFSAVRHLYKAENNSHSQLERTKLIYQIFKDTNDSRHFTGYSRNYFRNILTFLSRNLKRFMELSHDNVKPVIRIRNKPSQMEIGR